MATWLAAWHFQPQPPAWSGFLLLPQSCPGSSGLGVTSYPHCWGLLGRASREEGCRASTLLFSSPGCFLISVSGLPSHSLAQPPAPWALPAHPGLPNPPLSLRLLISGCIPTLHTWLLHLRTGGRAQRLACRASRPPSVPRGPRSGLPL